MVPEGPFVGFLAASFSALACEIPEAYGRLCRDLAGREVLLVVDTETVAVDFTPVAARLLPAPRRPSVELRTSRAAILDLVDARETLTSAVIGDRLVLRGSLDELLRLHDGLITYLHGAVRAPSFPALLRRYRRPGGPALPGV